jgi:hypothetical protein
MLEKGAAKLNEPIETVDATLVHVALKVILLTVGYYKVIPSGHSIALFRPK